MSAVALQLAETKPSMISEHSQILRFRRSERLVHWALAMPFMVCYTTALILVAVYNPNPARPFRAVVSWTHRISGMCLFILPLWTVVRNRHEIDLHLHNIRQVWNWTLDDVKWLLLIGPASVCRKISLPHQGKFNAGEKLNFMSVSSTYSIYILTGLGIWFGGAYLCWLVHFSLAVMATPLIVGHILMATVNPDTRPGLTGMISGFVDREWAKHHYHRWYQEHYGSKESVRKVADPARPVVQVVRDRPRLEPPVRPIVARPEQPKPAVVNARSTATKAAPAACPRCGNAEAVARAVAAGTAPAGRRPVADNLDPDASFRVGGGGVDAAAAAS
jgi:formate dehydrogenase subunit gamma